MNRRRTTPWANRRRSGLTLFEVLLSLLILGIALAAVGQLVSNGMRAAVRTQLESQAVMRCESIIAEVLGGIRPLEEVRNAAFPDDPRWLWSLSVTRTEIPRLWRVEVVVHRPSHSREGTVSLRLTRLIHERDGRDRPFSLAEGRSR